MGWKLWRRHAVAAASTTVLLTVVPVASLADRTVALSAPSSTSGALTTSTLSPPLTDTTTTTTATTTSGPTATTAPLPPSSGATNPPSPPPTVAATRAQGDTKTPCVYPRNDVRTLQAFGRSVGNDFTCALVYNNAATTWTAWRKPWFVVHGDPNFNWAKWTAAQPGRMLIVSQALIPTRGVPRNWRALGAAGRYDAHARALATNLVASGLGHVVIRLAFEANGPWMIDSLGTTEADRVAWRAYWRRFVAAMRSVPGAHFEFDWTVNAGYRALAFDSYYPGDDVVDIIGIDGYDSSVTRSSFTNSSLRWSAIAGQAGGLSELAAFARTHHKPMSIPEWGLTAKGPPMYGAGDNPTYVNGIARIVRDNVVRYHCYFLSATGGVRMTLDSAPRSKASYRRHFGALGDSR